MKRNAVSGIALMLLLVIVAVVCSTFLMVTRRVDADYVYTDFESGFGGWEPFTYQPVSVVQLSTTYAHSGTHSVEMLGLSHGNDTVDSGGGITLPVTSTSGLYVLTTWVYITQRSSFYACSFFGFVWENNESVGWNPLGNINSYVLVRQSEGYQQKNVNYGLTEKTWHRVSVSLDATLGTVSVWLDGTLIVNQWPAFNAGEKPTLWDIHCWATYTYPSQLHQYVDDVEVFTRRITILSPQNRSYAATSIPLTFTVDGSTAWMGYSLDGQANVTATGNTTLTGLLEGTHRVVMYANDTVGTMEASNTVYFTVDTTPPTVAILSPANTTYVVVVANVPLTFTVNEPTSWRGYSLDGQANVTISGNTTLIGLTYGFHSVTVYANDTARNMGASTTVFFTVIPDTTPPTVIILSPTNTTYVAVRVPLTFTVNEPTSWRGYSLDHQANVTISGNTTLTVLTGGPHNVIVYANDTSGNMGASTTVFFTMGPVGVYIVNAVTVFPGYRLFETTEVFNEWTLPINVTVNNISNVPLAGTVSGWYSLDNATWLALGAAQPIALNPGDETLLVFYWDLRAAGAGKAVYPLKFNATAISENLTTIDEVRVTVKVRIMGDADGDNDVDVGDQRKTALTMFKAAPDPIYLYYNGPRDFDPHRFFFTDMDGDGDVDVGDQRKQEIHMFQTWWDP